MQPNATFQIRYIASRVALINGRIYKIQYIGQHCITQIYTSTVFFSSGLLMHNMHRLSACLSQPYQPQHYLTSNMNPIHEKKQRYYFTEHGRKKGCMGHDEAPGHNKTYKINTLYILTTLKIFKNQALPWSHVENAYLHPDRHCPIPP